MEHKGFFEILNESQSNILTSDKVTTRPLIYSKLIVGLLLWLDTLVSDSLDLITQEPHLTLLQ